MAIPLVANGIAINAVTTAQAQQVDSSGVSLRFARFWRGDGRTLLEGVIGLPLARAQRSVAVDVRDSTGKALYSESWEDTARVQVGLATAKAETTTPLQVVLQAGAYTVAVRVTEAGRADSTVVQIRAFDQAPVISDVVVSASMRVLAQNEPPELGEIQRGRYAIERGTRVTVFPSEPRLWYYIELYRQGVDSVAQLELTVVPEGKDSALTRVARNVAVSARGTVDAAAMVVQGLPPGNYVLGVNAKSGNRQEKRNAPFTMASFESEPPTLAVAPGAVAAGGNETRLFERYFSLGVSSDADISRFIEALTVGAPDKSVGSENMRLPTDAKRRFLARYWARVPDPTPATPAHELLEEYSQRVLYVDREFRESQGGGRSAVKTDRGRIYLRYGAPDASQHIQIPSSNRSVAIWKYTRRRPLKYVFLDETGFSNYNLIYSTDPVERTLPDWEDRIQNVDVITQIVNF